MSGRLVRPEPPLGDTLRAVVERLDELAARVTELEDGPAAVRGQPDWLGVARVDVALAMLTAAQEWARDVLRVLRTDVVLAPCWPWHPRAVVVILAAARGWTAALRSSSPTTMAEELHRWQPAAIDALRAELAQCDEHGHHTTAGRCDVDTSRTDDLAAWWAADRRGRPPGLGEPRAAGVLR